MSLARWSSQIARVEGRHRPVHSTCHHVPNVRYSIDIWYGCLRQRKSGRDYIGLNRVADADLTPKVPRLARPRWGLVAPSSGESWSTSALACSSAASTNNKKHTTRAILKLLRTIFTVAKHSTSFDTTQLPLFDHPKDNTTVHEHIPSNRHRLITALALRLR